MDHSSGTSTSYGPAGDGSTAVLSVSFLHLTVYFCNWENWHSLGAHHQHSKILDDSNELSCF